MILAAVLVMVPLARTPGSLPHDTPTTTAVITDDFLTLFPDGDASQDGFVSDGDEPDQTTIPATGDSPVTAGSIALAVVLTGVLAGRDGVGIDDAFRILRMQARNERRSVADVAAETVSSL